MNNTDEILSHKQIDLLKVKLPRKTLQCGLSNEEFGENITDWRLQHHIPNTMLNDGNTINQLDEIVNIQI